MLKLIHTTMIHHGLFDKDTNKMYSSLMDARQANTYDKTSDGCGFSYLYFFSLGAPQNQLDDVRHRIPEYASLASAIQNGVSTSHFQRNGNASIDHLRAHRANMPVKSLPCSVIFFEECWHP